MDTSIQTLVNYIRQESIFHLDSEVVDAAKDALIDIVAATVAGSQTDTATMMKGFVLHQWGKGQSSVFLSADRLTETGAALVHATMANALDIDDGHRLVKGHPGAVIFPAVFAVAEALEVNGKDFLDSLLVGYETGIRAGILAHHLRSDYHCTGSWGALGAAAGVAKTLGLNSGQIEDSLGIAEYHATYAPMMRGIERPSMVKDAIGWGSMTGLSAAYLGQRGWTGIDSLFTKDEAIPFLKELGTEYRIKQLYYKPFACCRWAQPSVQGMEYLIQNEGVTVEKAEKIVIYTFTEASRLSTNYPLNTEEAQYNIAFPMAAYLVCGEVGPQQVLCELNNPHILQVMDRVEVRIDRQLDAQFPTKALSRVEVYGTDGTYHLSPVMQARGDYDQPLTKVEKRKKFLWLMSPLLGMRRSEALLEILENIEQVENVRDISYGIKFASVDK